MKSPDATDNTAARKTQLYFEVEVHNEIHAEATRQDRSVSWIVKAAWKIARKQIMSDPASTNLLDEQ